MRRQGPKRLKFSWLTVFIVLGMAGLFAAVAPLEKKIQGIAIIFGGAYLYARFMTEITIEKSDWLFGGWMLIFFIYYSLIKHIALPDYLFWLLYSLAVLSVFIFYLCWRKKQRPVSR